MERKLNPAGTLGWNTDIDEATEAGEAGERGGARFFRGVIAAGLISLLFWALAGWFFVSYLLK